MYKPAPRDMVISTFWLSDRDHAAGKRPVMHVYGPYSVSQARRVKREFEAEELPEPGYHYISVNKIIGFVDGKVTRVVHMDVEVDHHAIGDDE